MLARLAINEICNHKRFFLLLVFNAALGLMGLATIEGFRASVQNTLTQRAKTLLGADLEVSGRTKPDVDRLIEMESWLPSFEVAETKSLYSMIRTGDTSRLVNIKVIPPEFPFYGELVFDGRENDLHEDGDRIWIYKELQAQLGLSLGDTVEIGEGAFTVAGVVLEDPQQGLVGTNLSPRVFMNSFGLERAALIRTGSLVRYGRSYKFLNGTELSESQRKQINTLIDDPGIRISTPKEAGDRLGTRLGYVSDFLGLISLVALFLASIGIFYLYRSYLFRRSRDMAIYQSLGLTSRQVTGMYAIQLFTLSVAATFLGLVLGYVFLQLAASLIVSRLLFPIEVGLSVRLVVLVVLAGVLGTLLLGLPLIRHITQSMPATLIRGFNNHLLTDSRSRQDAIVSSLYFLPWCLFFGVLSLVISRSYLLGAVFFVVFIGFPIVCLPSCLFLLKRIVVFSRNMPLVPRIALLYSGRYSFATSATFIAITFLVLLLNLVPMIGEGLLQELRYPEKQRLPSFFLFDIQPEQTEDIATFVEQQESSLRSLSPIVRGRLVSINEAAFERMSTEGLLTREEEQESRFRNRGLNLTYRSELDESESIVSGEFFTDRFEPSQSRIGAASIEQRFAKRLGIVLGDILEIEVFAMPIRVEITSIRRVRWTSFSPNFFLVLQPGIIDDAPATFLAATTHIEEGKRSSFQAELLRDFPTISVIDLNRLIERLLSIGGQIRHALLAMIFLTIAVGALVLYSITAHQMQMKRRDIVLLKTLGLDFPTLKKVFRFEVAVLSASAILVGSVLGAVLSRFVGVTFFDTIWSLDATIPIGVGIIVGSITITVAEIAVNKVLRVPAREILQED